MLTYVKFIWVRSSIISALSIALVIQQRFHKNQTYLHLMTFILLQDEAQRAKGE